MNNFTQYQARKRSGRSFRRGCSTWRDNLKPAQKVYWGGYSGYFKDPDGYLFEVAYNPFWEVDDNDNIKLK